MRACKPWTKLDIGSFKKKLNRHHVQCLLACNAAPNQYRHRTAAIQSRKTVRYRDRRGPVALVIMLETVLIITARQLLAWF